MKKAGIIIVELLLMALAFGVLYTRGVGLKESEETAVDVGQRIISDLPEPPVIEFSSVPKDKDEWYLMLINPWNSIPDGYVESLDLSYIEGYRVDERVREHLEEMLAACRDAGHRVQLVSVFRTHAYQAQLYNNAANKMYSAYPGTSEHECGFAADIIDSDSAGWGDPLIDAQEDMPAQKWLMEHCQDYGFILRFPKDKVEITGILYEPWHYRYVGKEHAAKIMESGQCLEEYLERLDYEEKERIGS